MDIFATKKRGNKGEILLMIVYIFPVLMYTGHGYCCSSKTISKIKFVREMKFISIVAIVQNTKKIVMLEMFASFT